jgi:hypothetical protein
LSQERALPRYFFHVADGYLTIDKEGTELADMASAKREAIRTSGEILRENTHQLSGTEWRMDVADEAGDPVFTLRFSATEHA